LGREPSLCVSLSLSQSSFLETVPVEPLFGAGQLLGGADGTFA